MPTPAVIPRSPFVPRTAQPPYSHVENSTRPELDRLGLTALRAMVDVEPYGSSDLGGDPSDYEPPSMTSASTSEDDNPEDPKNPSGKKKKKMKKTRRPGGHRSQEAKAIATSKIMVNLPEFTGKDLSKLAENFGRFLRLTGQTHASGQVKCDLLLQCCKTQYLEKQVKQIVTKSATFADVLVALERQYPTYGADLCIRAEIENLPLLPDCFIVISTLCVCCASPAACCCCRVSGCLFLMRKMFYLLKYNQSRITQACPRPFDLPLPESLPLPLPPPLPEPLPGSSPLSFADRRCLW